MRLNSNTKSPTVKSEVFQDKKLVDVREDVVGSVPDVHSTEPLKESGTVYHKASDSSLQSLASLETQPTLPYNASLSQSQSLDYSYDGDKKPTYSPLYNVPYPYENEQYGASSLDPTKLSQNQSVDSQASQQVNPTKTTQEKPEVFQPELTDPNLQQKVDPANQVNPFLSQVYCPEGIVKQQNKVVAVNPVILVDKVERSLIVQWYENSVKREQRISYKKYGNAKAQQRAEGLISKLLAGSTFDQLYPEKGPPILTIFENVGKYMVSLTRDRIIREWRVDWLNNNGTKMRARWSCKKVGNEEARKRAEAFAYSLIQGTFNPRLLHKATGTRLSKNDMKYNAVVSGLDSQIESKAMNQLNESNWQNVDVQPKRRTKKRSVKTTEPKKGKTRRRSSSTYSDATTASTLGSSSLSGSVGAAGLSKGLNNALAAATGGTNDVSQYMKSHCFPFMNMVQDPSYAGNAGGFYPMFQEDVDSSAVNQQLDPNNTFGTGMLQQSWMDWSSANNLQKLMPFNQDWDFSSNPAMVEYPFFPQQGTGNMAPNNSNMSWDPMTNYTNMNMYMHQNELQTGREFDDQTDSRLTNQYYGYFGNDQGYGFQDNMLNQDQMMMSGYYNYPNTMRMEPSQWTEENKDYTGEYAKEYPEEVKQEEGQTEKDLSQVTTLANYKNLTGASLDSNELPPQNLSVSTRMYTSDHYGYINSDLSEVKQEEQTLNCFSGELEDPLNQPATGLQGRLPQTLTGKKGEFPMYQKDKFAENYDNATYREMEEPVMYYSM